MRVHRAVELSGLIVKRIVFDVFQCERPMLIESRYLTANLAPSFEVAACAVKIAMAGLMCWGGCLATPALVDFVMVVNRLAWKDKLKADCAGHISMPSNLPFDFGSGL